MLLTCLFVQVFCVSFMSFSISYIFHQPVFEEKNPETGEMESISESKYCLSPEKYSIKEDQFQSVVLKYGLYCEK